MVAKQLFDLLTSTYPDVWRFVPSGESFITIVELVNPDATYNPDKPTRIALQCSRESYEQEIDKSPVNMTFVDWCDGQVTKWHNFSKPIGLCALAFVYPKYFDIAPEAVRTGAAQMKQMSALKQSPDPLEAEGAAVALDVLFNEDRNGLL